MRIYTVHELPGAPLDGGGVVFLREGFSWAALFFTWIWALVNKLWLVAGLFFAISVALAAVLEWLVIDQTAALMVTLAIQIFFAMEANELRRWTLERRGYRLIRIVAARNQQDAELAFFGSPQGQALMTRGPRPTEMSDTGPIWPKRQTYGEDVLGLFPKADH